MNKIFFSFIILYTCNVHGSDLLNENCQNSTIKLDIFSKNDFLFSSKSCIKDDRSYVINYLKNKSENLLVNKKEDEFGYDFPTLDAVSIFKKK